jgi:hypothetical protein
MTLPAAPGVELTASPLPLAPQQDDLGVGAPYLRIAPRSAPDAISAPDRRVGRA